MRRGAAAGAVVGVVLALLCGSSAWALVAVRIQPRQPVVGRPILVTFRTDRRVGPGYRYAVVVVGTSGRGCAHMVSVDAPPAPSKGRRVTVRLRASDGAGGALARWCPGQAFVSIKLRQLATQATTLVGYAVFRFAPR